MPDEDKKVRNKKEYDNGKETSKINFKNTKPQAQEAQRSTQTKCQKTTPTDIIFRMRKPNTIAVSWKKLEEGNISPTEKQHRGPRTDRMGRFLQNPGKGDPF